MLPDSYPELVGRAQSSFILPHLPGLSDEGHFAYCSTAKADEHQLGSKPAAGATQHEENQQGPADSRLHHVTQRVSYTSFNKPFSKTTATTGYGQRHLF